MPFLCRCQSAAVMMICQRLKSWLMKELTFVQLSISTHIILSLLQATKFECKPEKVNYTKWQNFCLYIEMIPKTIVNITKHVKMPLHHGLETMLIIDSECGTFWNSLQCRDQHCSMLDQMYHRSIQGSHNHHLPHTPTLTTWKRTFLALHVQKGLVSFIQQMKQKFKISI